MLGTGEQGREVLEGFHSHSLAAGGVPLFGGFLAVNMSPPDLPLHPRSSPTTPTSTTQLCTVLLLLSRPRWVLLICSPRWLVLMLDVKEVCWAERVHCSMTKNIFCWYNMLGWCPSVIYLNTPFGCHPKKTVTCLSIWSMNNSQSFCRQAGII